MRKKLIWVALVLTLLATRAHATISYVTSTAKSSTSVTISWYSDVNESNNTVRYSVGAGCTLTMTATVASNCATQHVLTVTGLAPGTAYCFRPQSTICGGSPSFDVGSTIIVTTNVSDTPTPTDTPSRTTTPTPTDTPTRTITKTFTITKTATISPTFTVTRTVTKTQTPTRTTTGTRTFTEVSTASFTYSPTRTTSPTISPTFSRSPTFTISPTVTPTVTTTPTSTISNTDTFSPTATSTVTETATPTITETDTASPTYTDTPTITTTATPTSTPTITGTSTPTPTSTVTASFTVSPTSTATPTVTPTFTLTPVLIYNVSKFVRDSAVFSFAGPGAYSLTLTAQPLQLLNVYFVDLTAVDIPNTTTDGLITVPADYDFAVANASAKLVYSFDNASHLLLTDTGTSALTPGNLYRVVVQYLVR